MSVTKRKWVDGQGWVYRGMEGTTVSDVRELDGLRVTYVGDNQGYTWVQEKGKAAFVWFLCDVIWDMKWRAFCGKTARQGGRKMEKVTERNVIVRTYSAGVHFGRIISQSIDGKRVVLEAARRIWSWRGRNTLHEIAQRGVGEGSRVSDEISRIELTEAIEIIDCTPSAVHNIVQGIWS